VAFELEDIGALVFLGVGLEDAFLLFFAQAVGGIFVESALVVVEDIETLDHLGFVVLVADDNCQFECLSGVVTTHFIVIDPAVHLLKFNADRERKFLEIKLAAVVFAEDVVLDLLLDIPLRRVALDLIIDQVEDEMHDSVLDLLAEVEFELLHLIEEGLVTVVVEDYSEELDL
jgi:hypothetical protein